MLSGFDEALAFTQARRPAALPNVGFSKQLREFAESEECATLRERYAFPPNSI
jgi:hypothetical protein